MDMEILNRMATRLGTEDTIDLLTFSLPLIVEREQALRSALLLGDRESARLYAHKTLSSVRLYGSERLEQLLLSVQTLKTDETDLTAFQQALSAELELAINAIQSWLAMRVSPSATGSAAIPDA